MKIVMIHGQNHKGSTYNIGRMIANKIGDEDNIVEFFLPKDLDHFCLGCYTCIEDDTKCPFYEEKNKIMTAVESADGYLLCLNGLIGYSSSESIHIRWLNGSHVPTC